MYPYLDIIKFIKKKRWGAPPGIEPGTSCTQSKNHTTRPRCQIHRPGIEPESQAWKANMLTTTPTMFE